MNRLTTTALLTLAGLVATSGSSLAQSACEIYRVKPGDTLRDIAKTAYGNDDFRAVYKHNKEAVGRNPNVIEVGIVLRLPCADGTMPGEEQTVAAEAAEVAKADEVAEADDTPKVVSFVTANGYLPYTDESLPEQGMMTVLIERAMLRAEPDQVYTVTFVNDWAAHLEALLPSMAFDASFPWTRPGCESQGDLSAIEFYSCQNYLYSAPFYEIVDGFFTPNGSDYEGARYFSDLEGAAICRPEGYSTSHLAEANLLPPVIRLVQPDSAIDCFELLNKGSVDVVAMDTRAGAQMLSSLGLEYEITENPVLSTIVPLQVAVHMDNPDAERLVAALNTGLRELHESGEWHATISEFLHHQSVGQTAAGTN